MKLLTQCFAVTALVAGLGFGSVSFADGTPLPPIDSFLTTIIDKSVVSGAVDSYDPVNKMYLFNYTGTVYSVETNSRTGQLTELERPIGTVVGQAAFPQSFYDLAGATIGYLTGKGPMPAMPAVIPWTCNKCTLKTGGSTYTSVVQVPGDFPDGSAEAMRMQGRAFTGLGPVEMTKISPMSLSVRMAGCSAVVGTDGPNKGKVGTICLNGTFTFDLASALTGGALTGTGTSNCITVLHTPIMPLK
jgi:hypothetical protein